MGDVAFADRMEGLETQIPPDHRRGRCPAIIYVKEGKWQLLDAWLGRCSRSDALQIGEEDGTPRRSNLLAAMARYAGPPGITCVFHVKATAAVVELFATERAVGSRSKHAPPWLF